MTSPNASLQTVAYVLAMVEDNSVYFSASLPMCQACIVKEVRISFKLKTAFLSCNLAKLQFCLLAVPKQWQQWQRPASVPVFLHPNIIQ